MAVGWCQDKRLGSEFVTDFVIGEKSSIGFEWRAVELESPGAMLFTRDGVPAQSLNKALSQIRDWRSWLKRNRDYADRPRSRDGLGLRDIDGDIPGLIIIGRRQQISEIDNGRRRQLMADLNLDIRSFDWLGDVARSRASQVSEWRRRTDDDEL